MVSFLENEVLKMSKPVEVNFNFDTLDHYKNSDDDMEQDLAKTCTDDFTEYGKIVATFDQQMDEWKAKESGENYRHLVASLDQKRRMTHDNCLNDINIINRMAKQDGLPAFAVASSNTANRTDYGNAIVEQCYEAMTKSQPEAAKNKDNSYKESRNIMNDYNRMLDGYTKYPLVKGKDGNFKFINMFTQNPVDQNTVTNYVKSRTHDNNKIAKLQQAQELAGIKPKQQLNLQGPEIEGEKQQTTEMNM